MLAASRSVLFRSSGAIACFPKNDVGVKPHGQYAMVGNAHVSLLEGHAVVGDLYGHVLWT